VVSKLALPPGEELELDAVLGVFFLRTRTGETAKRAKVLVRQTRRRPKPAGRAAQEEDAAAEGIFREMKLRRNYEKPPSAKEWRGVEKGV